ncbi:hypothetical protein ACTXGQ_33515, partial [Marinobacter sp. 1Y8]
FVSWDHTHHVCCVCRVAEKLVFAVGIVFKQQIQKRRLDLQGAVKKLTQSECHKGNLAVIFHTIF